MSNSPDDLRTQAVIDAYKPICLCNKIRKGVVLRAIRAGAKTFEMVSRRTRVGTGPCGAARCGPMVRGFLGEPVETCQVCGWSILKGPPPLVCPRCSAEHGAIPRHKEIELIMFDLDGTLANTGRDIGDAVNHARSCLGLASLPQPSIWRHVGRGVEHLIQSILPASHRDRTEEAKELFLSYYRKHLVDTTVLYPNVLEVLAHYGDKKKAVISNKLEDLTVAILHRLGIENYFDIVLGGDSTARKKPNPEPLTHALSFLDVAPHRAVMIGDDQLDVQAGKSAGVHTCGVTYGLGSLIDANPDLIIDDVLQLKDHYR